METDDGITTSGGTITAWADASGKGNHLTGAGDPALSGTTPSGMPVVDLDGTGDKLERLLGLNGLPVSNANRTVFFVVDYVNPQGVTAGAVFGDNEGNQAFGLVTSTAGNLMVQGYGGANDFPSTTDGLTGGFIVQSAVLQNGTLKQYKNGGLPIDTDSHTFATDLERIVLGEEIGGKGFSALKVGAMIVYDRALSDTERGQVETYLQQKYLQTPTGNTPPIAVGEEIDIATGATVTINVLANDKDNASLTGNMISIVDGPDHGTITGINATTGAITYKHSGAGDDSFTYKLTDGQGAVSHVATVTIDAPGGFPSVLEGFSDELVINRAAMGTGGSAFQPISMAFTADNRMLLVSKTGEIRIVDPETGANAVLMKLTNIDSGNERGLLDITLDPNFETNHFFYLYYTPASPQHARISRFTFQENSGGLTSKASLSSELKIWEDTDGYIACCHYGGGLDFGTDGKIWLTTSDKFQSTTPGEGPAGGQDLMLDLTSSSGKIIRINKDGSIPADNPFKDGPGGNDDSIWAYGLRNPFRARWDAEYGQMYIGEVGGNQQNIAHDDLHLAGLGQKGAFYGWPFYEGTTNTYVNAGASPKNPNNFPAPDNDLADPASGDFYSAPIWSLPHNGNNASLTGGEVYRGNMFPAEWDGVYFYGDYTRDYIRYLVLSADGTKVLGDFPFKPSAQLPGTTNEVVSISVGADGALYYAMISSGEVHRVVFEEGNAAPEIVATSLTPTEGALPLAVTYSATISDADGDVMTYTVNFGDGTVVTGTVPANGLISVPHTFTSDGAFEVSLTVSDGSHNSFAAPIDVVAGDTNDAPAITGEVSDVEVGGAGTTEITFTANATDADGDTMSYVWHFGDGSTAAGTVGANGVVTATHIYAQEGTYEAFLDVSDGVETTTSEPLPIQIGTATQVPITNGLVLLLESDIKIGLGTGNTVTAWLDGSGSGNNLFAQGNPQLLNDQTPTGQPAIVFDGTGDLLQRINATEVLSGFAAGAADRTIFFVVDYVNPEGVTSGVAYGDSAQNESFGLVAGTDGKLTVQGYGAANDFKSGTDGVTGGFMVESVVLKDSVTHHYKNGTQIDTDPHTFATDLKKLVLGAEIGGLGQSQLKIGAVLIYNRAVTDSQRLQIEDFLQKKYITGTPTQVAPVAGNDTASTTHAVAVAIDVLANDSDGNNDPLTITAVTNGANGTAVINKNGTLSNPADDTIVYTPNTGFVGTTSFTYTIADGHGNSDVATVTVNVTGTVPNTPPVAGDDTATTGINTAVTLNVLANDSDPNGDTLAITALLTPAHGTAVINNNGTPTNTADDKIVYTPNAGFTGSDAFTYTISDGKGGTDTAAVNVTVTGPTAGVPVTAGLVAAYQADENVSLASGTTVQGWLDGSGHGNDLVALGNPQLVASATPTGEAAIVFDGTGDLLQRINATDTLSGFAAGAADRTIFFVVDYVAPEGVTSGVAYGDSAQNQTFGLVAGIDGKLTVQGYGSANDFKSATDGVAGGFLVESVVLKSNVTSHYKNGVLIDTDPHTYATDLKKLVLGAEIGGLGQSQLKIGAVLIYNRALSSAEQAQVETYLQSKYVVLTAPVAADDAFVFVEDTPITGNVLANNGAGPDSDPNGDPLSVTLVADVEHGTLALNGNGSFSYTPDKDFAGVDSFDYNISDGKGGTDRATVTLTATPVNDPATALDDSYATKPGTLLAVSAANGVLANDSDPEGNAFTATLGTNVAHGGLSLNANGSFNYTPNAGFVGTDSFTYKVTGGDAATVTIKVGAPALVTAGLVAKFESTAGITLGAGSTVTGWTDGSGKGNHLFAGGNPQLVVDATPTGASAIAFDGTGDLLQRVNATNALTGLATGPADRTMFLVVDYKDPNGVTSGLAYGDGAGNEAFGLVAAKNGNLMVQGFSGANDFPSTEDGVTGGFLIQSVVLKGNVASHYRDGELIDTDTHAFGTDLKKLILGGEIANLGQSEMEIAGAVIYNRALTEPERTEVEAYLHDKYLGDDLFA